MYSQLDAAKKYLFDQYALFAQFAKNRSDGESEMPVVSDALPKNTALDGIL